MHTIDIIIDGVSAFSGDAPAAQRYLAALDLEACGRLDILDSGPAGSPAQTITAAELDRLAAII